MNYSKVGWSNKSAITQSDMTHMDEALYALAQETSSNTNALGNLPYTKIQAGVYYFGSSTTEEDLGTSEGRSVKRQTIQFSQKFSKAPYVIVTANSNAPDSVNATVSSVKTDQFSMVLKYDPRYKPGSSTSTGGIIKLAVYWIAIGK